MLQIQWDPEFVLIETRSKTLSPLLSSMELDPYTNGTYMKCAPTFQHGLEIKLMNALTKLLSKVVIQIMLFFPAVA